MEKIGYGTALFDFTQEEHIAPAVKCPIEYSYNNSGYCYAEVTDVGFKIGEMPTASFDNGKAKTKIAIGQYKANGNIKLVSPSYNINIYRKTNGNSYQKVIETSKTIKRIEGLEKELDRSDSVINLLKNELIQLENNANYYDEQAKAAYGRHEVLGDNASYNEYSRLFSQYESAYDKYKSRADEHGREVAKYNDLVDEYNALIDDFYEFPEE